MRRRHHVRSSLPTWRRRQLDADAASRDTAATHKVGVLMDWTDDDTAAAAWLRLRPERWKDLPSDHDPIGVAAMPLLSLVQEMIADGALEPAADSEHLLDYVATIRRLIGNLRLER